MRSFYALVTVIFALVLASCLDHGEEPGCTVVDGAYVCEGDSDPNSTDVTIDVQLVDGERSVEVPMTLLGYSYDALDNTLRQDLVCKTVSVQTDTRLRCSLGRIADQQFVHFMVYKAENRVEKTPVCATNSVDDCLASVAVQGDQLDPPILRLVPDDSIEGGVAYSFIVHVP